MKRAIARLLSLAGGAAGAVACPGPTIAQDDLSCAIDLVVKDGVAEIRGIATSRAGGRATYRLIVQKSGSAGTSNLSQGGEVVLEPSSPVGVGSVSVSIETGSRYEAVLTLDIDGLRRECRKTGETDLKL